MTQFRRQPRSDAQVEHHLRRHELNKLAPLVPSSAAMKDRVVALLRAEGLDAVAELITCGTWPRRGRPSLDPFEERKRSLVAHMRLQKKYHGPWRKGERKAALERHMDELAESNGDLAGFSNDERKRLRDEVLADMDRAKRKRRRVPTAAR